MKVDLNDFWITDDLDQLKQLKSYSFKNMVKRKAKEFDLMTFLEQKEKHSKNGKLYYTDLKLRPYLNSEVINKTWAKTVFSFRTRMADFCKKYGKISPYPLCHNHSDTQKWSFSCKKVVENEPINGQHSNIFSDKVKPTTVKTKFRKEYTEQRHLK